MTRYANPRYFTRIFSMAARKGAVVARLYSLLRQQCRRRSPELFGVASISLSTISTKDARSLSQLMEVSQPSRRSKFACLNTFPSVAALCLVICFFAPCHQARANVLNGTDEALAAMMTSQEDDTGYLMRRFGLLTNTLEFTSNYSHDSFEYSLASGSSYNGSPIAMTTTGTRVGLDSWTISTSGSLAGSPFTATTMQTFTIGGVPGDAAGGVPEDQDVDGKDGHWDWHSHISWRENPLDPTELLSYGYKWFTYDGVPGKYYIENDSRKRTLDELIEWATSYSALFDPSGFGTLVASGTSTNGVGTFSVSNVPEPTTLSLFGAASLLIAAGRLRRRKRTPQ